MSASHDTHHSTEQKPVAFTVPLILACVLILIIGLFLSLCDPKPHGHDAAGHGDHAAAATEATHHHDAAAPHEEHHAAATTAENKDSMSVETAAPEAEAQHEAHH